MTHAPDTLWSFHGSEPAKLPKHKRINGFTWSNLPERSASELAGLGYVQAPEKPKPLRGYYVVWEDNIWKQEQLPGSPLGINDHRATLVKRGVLINVTGVPHPVRVAGELDDQVNLLGLYNAALLRMQMAAQGDTAQAGHVTVFRDEDNVDHNLMPAQVIELWSKGAAWVSMVYQASWNLKDAQRVYGMEIPHDFEDGRYWPPEEI